MRVASQRGERKGMFLLVWFGCPAPGTTSSMSPSARADSKYVQYVRVAWTLLGVRPSPPAAPPGVNATHERRAPLTGRILFHVPPPLHCQSTHYAYAKHLEKTGDFDAALEHYEKAGAASIEVPRMYFESEEMDKLEAYVKVWGSVEVANVLTGWVVHVLKELLPQPLPFPKHWPPLPRPFSPQAQSLSH
eukprot:290272-Chlamydomonas_euryale.AAC.1